MTYKRSYNRADLLLEPNLFPPYHPVLGLKGLKALDGLIKGNSHCCSWAQNRFCLSPSKQRWHLGQGRGPSWLSEGQGSSEYEEYEPPGPGSNLLLSSEQAWARGRLPSLPYLKHQLPAPPVMFSFS